MTTEPTKSSAAVEPAAEREARAAVPNGVDAGPHPHAVGVAVLVLGLVLLPFFALATFAHPQNDDWVFAATALQMGYARANAFWYEAWTGRYAATAILSGFDVLASVPGGFGSILAANLALVVGGAVAAALGVLPTALGTTRRVAVGLLFAALHLATLPSASEGIYWLAGAVTYQLSSALVMLLVGVLGLLERTAGWRRAALALAGAALAAAVAGGNEVSVVLLDALAGGWLLSRSWRARRVRLDLLAIAAAAAGGSVVALLAPGNHVRLESSGGIHPANAIALAAPACAGFIARWTFMGPVIPGLALAAPALATAARAGGWRLPHPVIAAIAAAVATLAAFAIPALGAGTIEPRAANVVHWVFLVAAFFVTTTVAFWLERRAGRPVALTPRGGAAIAAVALMLCAAFPTSLRLVTVDLLSGEARRFDAAIRDRYRRIAVCRGPVCEVPRIAEPPRSLVWFEDAIDEGQETPFFENYKGAYAFWFGKYRIRLQRAADAAPR